MDEAQYRRQVANLTTLLEISKGLAASTELQPLLEQIEQATLSVLDCERATVFLYDAATDELYSQVATGEVGIRFSAKLGIAGEAARTRSIINVPDAYADARFNQAVDKKTGFQTRNLISFCLTGYDGKVVGVLQALNKRGGPFVAVDEELAVTLSSLAGVVVQRQMLLDEYAAKQKMESDLALARDIQQSLLPESAPIIKGYDMAGWNKPADATGGDCYDFIELEDNQWGFVVADATGHGIGPALCVSECRALLRALILSSADLQAGMQRTNAQLAYDMPTGRFVTTFYGVLDPKEDCIQYISAGHGPLLLYQAASDGRIELPASTFPMGISPEMDTELPEPIRLQPRDVFLAITDGFFEWMNHQDEQFGLDRVFDLLKENPQASSAELIEILHEAVVQFGQGTPQADDLTAIILRRD